MRTLLAALGFCVGIVAGSLNGSSVLVAAAVAVAVLAAAGSWARGDSRRRTALFVVGLAAAGVVRGSRGEPEVTAPRGARRQLRELQVVGASDPGPRCRVHALDPGGRHPWIVETAPERCPLAHGQRIEVLESAFDERGSLPELGEPGAAEEAGEAPARIVSEQVWPVTSPSSRYWTAVAEIRRREWDRARADDAKAVVSAAVFGVASAMPPGPRLAMRAAGLGHLLAVSGLNVALAAWAFRAALIRVGLWLGHRPGIGIVFAWAPLIAFVGLTGAEAPAVRAAVMVVLLGLGQVVGRPVHGLTTLAVALAGMLAWEPSWVSEVGFQLSATAMLAIVTAPPPGGAIALHWRIAWFIAPLSAWHFREATIHGVVVNLLAVPLFSLFVLPAAMIGWALEPVVGPIARAPADHGARLLLDVAELFAPIPGQGWGALAGCAAAALGLRPLLSWQARKREWPRRVEPWLPPVLPCAVLLALALTRGLSPAAASASSWYAIGGLRARTLVGTSASGGHCLRDPSGSPRWWARVLPGLGVVHLTRVEGRPSPHLEELGELLRAEGLLRASRAACTYPAPELARRSLDACRWRVGGGRAVVRGGRDGEPPECLRGGRWWSLGAAPQAGLIPSKGEASR